MATLPLPFSGGLSRQDAAVFDVHNDAGGIAVQGRSLGSDQGGYGGTGVVGTADSGGIGVSGDAKGIDIDQSVGWGVSGTASEGGIAVRGEASGSTAYVDRDGSQGIEVAIGVLGI